MKQPHAIVADDIRNVGPDLRGELLMLRLFNRVPQIA
jgi:hypothetical protein